MAFALTGFASYGVNVVGPSQKRGIQRATLYITGLVTDVDLDLGDDSGTFWTEAQANSTYGELATKALDVINKIEDRSTSLIAVKSEQLIDRLQVAVAAGTSYTLAVQAKRPNIEFAAGQGETTYQIDIEWLLNNFQFPIVSSFGTIT
jgi:hypothetical protein